VDTGQDIADTDGAIPPDMADTDGDIMAIRCTTVGITAAEDGTGAEATMEGAGAGNSRDLAGRAGISRV